MPDTPTTRLSLYKSLSDGSELVDYSQDLGQNWDKVDAAAGFAPCTTTTRPSAPYQGKGIMQTDTAYSTYVHNGSTPASAGWIEIPNSSAAYGGRFITLYPGSTSSSALMRLAQTGAASGNRAFATRGAGDTADHFFFDFDGKLQWGAGGGAGGDTNLYRGAANQLKTDDDLVIVGNLTAGNITTGAATAYTPVWSGTSVSLGNGTIAGSYFLIGKLCIASIEVVAGTTTNFGSGIWSFTVPFTAASGPAGASANWAYSGAARGHASKWYAGTASVLAGTNTMRIYEDQGAAEWGAAIPTAWSPASSSYWHATVAYETA